MSSKYFITSECKGCKEKYLSPQWGSYSHGDGIPKTKCPKCGHINQNVLIWDINNEYENIPEFKK